MTKDDLITSIIRNIQEQDKPAPSREMTGRMLIAFQEEVTDAIKMGDSVTLKGFGRFTKRSSAARMGRNPATGEPLQIQESSRIGFKAASKL